MRLNWLDRALQPFAPRLAVKRAIARSYLEERGYDGAAMGRRTSGMRAPSTSADSEIAKALPTLRARMRELGRNSPHAKKALTVWTNNLVGTGIMPRAKSGNEKLDKAAMDLWEKMVEAGRRRRPAEHLWHPGACHSRDDRGRRGAYSPAAPPSGR